ncbi:hypothetical protein [uncultured Roseivirga sp.]|uniref:hypothetical protein n=1 Tax=uncultured Roseivirga sp. TaxID=543088 RepID=UPI0030DA40BC|tara:strand:- start:94930 stop:95475 length:546 start_codon:yes stop_codon:yes gene_type:complete
MLDFRVILDIRKDALKSMKCDSDDVKISSHWKRFIFISVFHLVPVMICVIAWTQELKLTTLENYIGSGIAIFTGLFFSLLLSIGAKIRDEKNNPDKDDNNFMKFKNNMKQIANITLYVIEIGVLIFIILLLNSLFKTDEYPIVERIFTMLALFFLARFLTSLFFMIQRFYHVMSDEINNIL